MHLVPRARRGYCQGMSYTKRRAHRPRTTPEERARTIARFHDSGLSRTAFARRHGLVLSTLIRWLGQPQPKPAVTSPVVWRELPVPSGLAVGSGWLMEVESPRGVKVRFREPPAMSELVRLFQDLSC